MKFTVVLSPDPDGGYSLTCPAMPGLVTDGSTRDIALANARLLIADFLEHGQHPLEETLDLLAAEVKAVLADRAEEGWEPAAELVTLQSAGAVAA